MKNYFKIFIFIVLLFLSNLFLLQEGTWFYNDLSYWPKHAQDGFIIFIQQLHAFTNTGYYIGYDQGLLNFTRIITVSVWYILVGIFGNSASQIIFSIIGYTVTFISFFLFSKLLFKKESTSYILSLIYTFSPLTYNLQGHSYYNAVIPLFLYSYYKFLYTETRIRFFYLFLIILSSFIWVSYIRFIPIFAIVIIPYCVMFFLKQKHTDIRKIILIILSYIIFFSPIIFSFFVQLVEKTDAAFNYRNVYGKLVSKYDMYSVLNVFHSSVINFYENTLLKIAGIILFCFFLYLLASYSKKKYDSLFVINLLLLLVGITLMGLANIFGENLYPFFTTLFPFVVNGPGWAMYIIGLPLVVLLGILTKNRMKYLYGYASLFILFSLIPLLNLSEFKIQKFPISDIPRPYQEYFIEPTKGLPEPTYYYLNHCWRAEYMEKANTPTQCFNFGHHYVPVLLDNPRLVSGETYELSQVLYGSTDVDNLRITHNLKHIIIPKDIVLNSKQSQFTKNIDQVKITNSITKLDDNGLLNVIKNNNFNHYYYKGKDNYDYLVYAPRKIVYKETAMIDDNLLDINSIPAVVSTKHNSLTSFNSPNLFYKMSPLNPTAYYLELSNIDEKNPFMIQLNQQFGPSWKAKIVDKEYFDKKICTTKKQFFSFTKNSHCQFNSALLELENIKLLSKSTLKDTNHIKSNFVSNGWILDPSEFRQHIQNNRKLYVVLIYEKQLYYSLAIATAFIAVIILIVLILFQELRLRVSKSNEK